MMEMTTVLHFCDGNVDFDMLCKLLWHVEACSGLLWACKQWHTFQVALACCWLLLLLLLPRS